SINLTFGLYHLGEKSVVDEPLWISNEGRVLDFWDNLKEGELWKTKISDKPGVTVAIISGLGLNFVQREEIAPEKTVSSSKPVKVNFSFRFPILIFNLLMLFVFYYFLKNLFNQNTALFSLVFIGTSPAIIGLSTIVNPDALLWSFLPISLLSLLTFLKNQKNHFLYWSGVFLGLALLTKYVANILYVFFIFLFFFNLVLNYKKSKNSSFSETAKKCLKDYLVLVAMSLMTIYLLLPEIWVNPGQILKLTLLSEAFIKVYPLFLIILALLALDIYLLKSFVLEKLHNFFAKSRNLIVKLISVVFLILVGLTLVNVFSKMKLYDFEAVLLSPRSPSFPDDFFQMMFTDFYIICFGIALTAFIPIVFLLIKNIFYKKSKTENFYWSACLLIFILLYYLGSTVNEVIATVRYQIIIFPLMFILAAIGVDEFFLSLKIKNKTKDYLKIALLCLFSLISVYNLYSIKPFYLSYANSLLPKEYIINLKDMGEGSYEAAEYLNSLANPEELIVWTDRRGVCAFFKGTCLSGQDDFYQNEDKMDYLILFAGNRNRTVRTVHADYLRELYTVEGPSDFYLKKGTREKDFVKVINAKKIDKYNN
ncbi:MAG: phospholipid carrier-dependent glycosyltransferase, partial [Candidatus Moranbacteria bacterium]|nr:phospholipid carrier-dependent glycosyltransferase [Candidatus Moranbacteria bacterium]